MRPQDELLVVRNLTTTVDTDGGRFDVVKGIDLDVRPGEIVGLVGESGSGKSMTARSIIGLLPDRRVRTTSGSIRYRGQELIGLSDSRLADIRGTEIAMIFQNPQSYLNPVMPIGKQIAESIKEPISAGQKAERVEELLSLAGIPKSRRVVEQYPHQLSGGMNQRALIAMALAGSPSLLLADEPTTALDLTIQAQILALLRSLSVEFEMSILMISHDLGVIAQMCDRVYVMYSGNIVEATDVDSLFRGDARHPYTLGLLRSIDFLTDPDAQLTSIPGSAADPADPPPGCRFHPRCEFAEEICRLEEPRLLPMRTAALPHAVACHFTEKTAARDDAPPVDRVHPAPASSMRTSDDLGHPLLELIGVSRHFRLPSRAGRKGGTIQAVVDVDLALEPGASLALVGESGSGKTTVAKMIMRLLDPSSGEIRFRGSALSEMDRDLTRTYRQRVQIVFQDPYASLNPTRKVRAILAQPFLTHRVCGKAEAVDRSGELLESVGLDRSYLRRYPHQLSGGERQRVAFARAIALNPDLIVADEPVSALDMSIRSQVLDLMRQEREHHGRSYVLITHDLANAAALTDEIAVLYLGRVVEQGPTRKVLDSPMHPYTAALIASTPTPEPPQKTKPASEPALKGEPPSALDPPSGCVFRTRCPFAEPGTCDTDRPPLRQVSGRQVACHFADNWAATSLAEPAQVENSPSRSIPGGHAAISQSD